MGSSYHGPYESVYNVTGSNQKFTPKNKLLKRHREMLCEESAIDPEVVAERGVRSVGRGRGELPKVFSWRQKKRAPGILFTVHRPNGETSYTFRPDAPDPKNPGHKYEQPPKKLGGSGNVLDTHPSAHDVVTNTCMPLVFTEGVKKADSITSAARREDIGIVAVAISGVYNWLSEGEPIEDMWTLPVEERLVYIAFDSDMFQNPNVQQAAERLAEYLAGRGAEVRIVLLPDKPDGAKNGADDFLAGGGTLEEMLELSREFDPEELQQEKLSRNEHLRRSLEYLERVGEDMPARTSRDCSKKAAWRACTTIAERRGKPGVYGISAIIPSMLGAEVAAISQPTFSKCLKAFEEEGLVRRNKPEQRDLADSYVLIVPRRALRYNHRKSEEKKAREESESRARGSSDDHGDHRRYNAARAPVPEVRWGYVTAVREKDARGRLREVCEYVARLGKRRGEVLRHLLDHGGASTIPELMERFAGEKTRPRDFKRRLLADLTGYRRQYRGEPLAVGPPIIEVEGDEVRLVGGWLEALEEHRTLGGEQDAAVRQKADNLRRRAAYRARSKTKADPAPTEEEMERRREPRRRRQEIDELEYEGMGYEFAAEEVIGAAGFVEDLHRVEEHPLSCECPDCSAPPPKYARPAKGSRA